MLLSTSLQFAYHALRMKLDRRYRVPLTTNIVLLLKCPFRCLYCPLHKDSSASLSMEVLKDVLTEVRRLGGRRVHFTGGEPLLRDDLGQIIRYAQGLGLFVSLTTRGFQARQQMDALRQADRVQLSFDGPQDVRIHLSGESASQATMEALELFKTHGVRFWLVAVLNKLNLPYIDWIVEEAGRHETEVSFVVMEALPQEWGTEGQVPEHLAPLMPTGDEIRQGIRRLIELKKAGLPVASSMPYLKELLEWPDNTQLHSSQRSRRYRCMAWQSQCELFANGQLHVCTWTMHRDLGQSIYEGGFTKAWQRLPRPENCRSCIVPCNLEANLVFSLNAGAILNWMGRLRNRPGKKHCQE